MRFMNLSKWLGQGYQEEASDGTQESGGAGGGEASDKGGDSGVMLTSEEYAQFQNMLKAGSGKPPVESKDKSNYDKIIEEENQKKQNKINESEIAKTINFDRDFDGYLAENKTLFNFDGAKFREQAKNLTGKELTTELARMAAKDFFSKPENIELLPEHDQQYIKKDVVNVPEKFIDADRAWALIQSAVHVSKKQHLHGQYKDGAAPNSTETPNVTAYIQRCKDAGKGIQKAS